MLGANSTFKHGYDVELMQHEKECSKEAAEATVAADVADAVAADFLTAGISLQHISMYNNGWNIDLAQGVFDWPAIERDLERGTGLFASFYVERGPHTIRGGGDEPAVEPHGDIGDMISTLVVAAQAEESDFVDAPPPIAGPRQPSNASTFMESSSGANPVDDSAPIANPIQVLADAPSLDGNFGGVPLPVAEPLLPPHASTVTQELDGASPVSIKVHAVETTPSIASRAELVDDSAFLGNMYESFERMATLMILIRLYLTLFSREEMMLSWLHLSTMLLVTWLMGSIVIKTWVNVPMIARKP